jgi:PTS system mannose-specific IIC component
VSADLLLLAGLGAVVAVDATSFGQLMLSRPLVAGTLAGALVNMPFEGALIGALIEILSLGVLPVGAARTPETGTAAVAAVGTLGLSGVAPVPEALLLVLVYAIILQWLFGASVTAGRSLNERLVHAGQEAARSDLHDRIERWHLTAMALDLLRGFATTPLAILAGAPLLQLGVGGTALPSSTAALVVAAATTAVLIATARAMASARRATLLIGCGVLCGAVLLLLQ